MIKHIVVRDILLTRFVLFQHAATGKIEVRYIEAGPAEPIDRLLAYNPELDRNDGKIISPEFKTCTAVLAYQADLQASLQATKPSPNFSSFPIPSESCCLDQAQTAQDVSLECPPTTTVPRLAEIGA